MDVEDEGQVEETCPRSDIVDVATTQPLFTERRGYGVVEVPLKLIAINAALIRCSSSSILQGHGTVCHDSSRASSCPFGEDVVSSNTGIVVSLMVFLSTVKRLLRCEGLRFSVDGVSSNRRMPSRALGSLKDEAGKLLTS